MKKLNTILTVIFMLLSISSYSQNYLNTTVIENDFGFTTTTYDYNGGNIINKSYLNLGNGIYSTWEYDSKGTTTFGRETFILNRLDDQQDSRPNYYDRDNNLRNQVEDIRFKNYYLDYK